MALKVPFRTFSQFKAFYPSSFPIEKPARENCVKWCEKSARSRSSFIRSPFFSCRFEELTDEEALLAFFRANFADSIPLIGKERLVADFLSTPPSPLVSIKVKNRSTKRENGPGPKFGILPSVSITCEKCGYVLGLVM